MVRPCTTLLCPVQDVTHLFGQSIQCCMYDLPISTGKKQHIWDVVLWAVSGIPWALGTYPGRMGGEGTVLKRPKHKHRSKSKTG